MGPNQNNGQYMPVPGPSMNAGYGARPSGMNGQPAYDYQAGMNTGYGARQSGMSFQNFANQNTQLQQRTQEKYLVCKFIDDPDSIMPIDVPSNGDPAFFVMRDYSGIYARAVNSRGTIDNVLYSPVQQVNPEDAERARDQEFRDLVFNKFANIESMLSSLIGATASDTEKPKAPKKNGGTANA